MNKADNSWFGGNARDYIRVGSLVTLGAVIMLALAMLARDFMDAALAVITPFLVGIGFALLLDPLVRRITRGRLTRTGATIMVFGLFLLTLVAIGYYTIPALIDQATSLAKSDYVTNFNGAVTKYVNDHHKKIGPVTVPDNFIEIVGQVTDKIQTSLQASVGSVASFLLGSATMVVQAVVAVIVGFYTLSDLDRLRARAYFLIPRKHRRLAGHLAADIGGVFSDYFRGLTVVCALYGVSTMVLLYAMSIWHHELGAYALLVGVAAGILYAVPYVGALSIALVTFVVAFSAGQWTFALIAVGLTLFLNQVFDNFVTPKVVGGGVGLHPVMALFALAIGGELFKLWGLLLSVPIAASVQVVLYRWFPKLREPTPDAFLLAEGADPETEGEGPKTGGGQADTPSDDISPAALL